MRGLIRGRQQRQLTWPTIVEVTIHIEPSEHPLNWIDRPILIAIEFLEMVLSQFRIVRVRRTCPDVMNPARIIPLGTL